MNEPRKKSPRAPTMPLDEALERALRAYERERSHSAPSDVIAQHIGYKSANNGAALSALASLRYFGLLDRPKEGFLAVSKDVEAYKFSPDERHKRDLLLGFLKRPQLYADLLEKYASGLPSEANLRYELIQRGFSPAAADGVMSAFIRSVQFAAYFAVPSDIERTDDNSEDISVSKGLEEVGPRTSNNFQPSQPLLEDRGEDGADRIPVRLSGGRRAWLIIPVPFFAADRARLKAQIDLLLAEDDA